MSDEERCSNCGHRTDAVERCRRCKRQFACGSLGEPCDVAGCREMVVATRYESREDAAEDAEFTSVFANPRIDPRPL